MMKMDIISGIMRFLEKSDFILNFRFRNVHEMAFGIFIVCGLRFLPI